MRFADHLPRLAPRRRVETGRRLVEEQQLRIGDQSKGHVEPTLLATRQRLDPRRRLLAEADDVDHVGDGERVTVVAGVHGQHLGHREVGIDAAFLQHDADALAIARFLRVLGRRRAR